ncbi:hypothetical protein HIM_02260 [Hirsutella minnesotensis 3608]|nr:hypothetical protein HIM_02260 [Hirsutella minnesotensis 3608]
MKFLLPLTLLVAAGVQAQDKNCLADYIAQDCPATDYDCLCAAYQAVATCYNNCPDDVRAPAARHQASVYCQNASLYGTKAHASKTTSVAAKTTSTAVATTTDSSDSTDAASGTSSSTSKPTSTNAAQVMSANGGAVVAVAGLFLALL